MNKPSSTRRLPIRIGVPAGLAVCGVVIATTWMTWVPAQSLALRQPWPEQVEVVVLPPGPPGVLTRADGVPAAGIAGSWPQFLGPTRNAALTGSVPLADQWPEQGPPALWSVALGDGHAGAAVHNGRVYVLDHDRKAAKDKRGDVLRCLSLADGKEIWRRSYSVPLRDNHGISRTVPAVTDKYVVTFGPACHVMCVDAVTGEYQWGMSLVGRYHTRIPEWYASQCPLIDGDKAIFATGGDKLMIAVALAPAEKGKPRILWETPNPVPGVGRAALQITHSSIVPTVFAGTRLYVYCSTKGVVGVSETGKLLWRYGNWQPGINAASPVILPGGRILVSADTGSLVLQMTASGGGIGVEAVLETPARQFSSYQQTPVLHDGRLYGVLSQKAGMAREQLACVDVRGGRFQRLWTSGRSDKFRWGPYLIADEKIFLLRDNGLLTMARATPAGYRRLARAKMLGHGDAWGPMALVDGRLLLRDKKRMICVDLRAR